jgi:hypothetical protein
MSLTHQGLYSGVGAPFVAARVVVGFGVSSAIAAKSDGLMAPGKAITYVVEQAVSAPLGRTPLTNATMAAAGAAWRVLPQAAAVGAGAMGLSFAAFEGGMLIGSVIEAGYYVRFCGRR